MEVITPVDEVEHDLFVGTLLLLIIIASGFTLVVGVSHFSIKKPLRETVGVMSSTSSQIAATVEQ
ncbi:MAG: hypothetical protein GKS05_02500 [Nitrospirales bacterium]|nr:hypothetical protein [Nitrospirales bacterium]